MAASVKVAVRVRPVNQRERDLNAVPIIEMNGKKTRICNSKHTTKQDGEAAREIFKDFTFDYSYWSCDDNDDHFASQEQVFMDLGTDVVQNAFQGYNACVFAYGQTGSGKTHTMMGTQNPPSGQGLIPRICLDMFNRMNQGIAKGTTYSTEVSYLEIYNERVKDLLTKDQFHNLKVREHPKLGPYVEGLSKHLVADYLGILDVMNRGNANRTTASTNMNDTSSRSHAIFTMTFVQASFVNDMPSETVSKIHLVDLAGSERADATGATGTRLKEGAHINKSLVTLGSVISALAELSQHSKNSQANKTFIPYRDSVLTWLLKDSLGGNSKTIMIATISPADVNYGETLSTLRYANRAKNIINKPTINEDANVKLIRELRAEIEKLKRKLASDISSESTVLEELHKKEAREKSLTEEWTEKWKETQQILMEEKVLALRKAGTGVVLDSNRPHLIGIDDDVLSTGITLYHLKEGETKIGSEEGNDKHDIMLKGLGLESQHCSIMLEEGVATLTPYAGSLCWVNGQQVDKPTRLFQGCVVLLGRTSMFRYNDPAEAEKLRKEGSKTHLSLSRLSFLSRSVTELGVSSENLDSSALAEESSVLEEKRKQLEAEEVRLQKESMELLQQKKLLEEQKCSYQQLQQQKEEAWTADIQSAQKEIEERKHKLELEYAAHRRRLEEDWKRLEQQEKETLASLQSKETDLRKRKEFLEWELEQEMVQIEAEAVRVDSLKVSLEKKQQEVINYEQTLVTELQQQLGDVEDAKSLLSLDDSKFELHLKSKAELLKEWKETALVAITYRRGQLESKLKELSDKVDACDDPNLEAELREQQRKCKEAELHLSLEVTNIQESFQEKMSQLDERAAAVGDARKRLRDKKMECEELCADVEKGIGRIVVSEKKIQRLESDLALIGDQEKLIVSQLSHIDSSKQKLLTIIENSTEVMDDDQTNSKRLQPQASRLPPVSEISTPVSLSTKDSSPLKKMNGTAISPIKSGDQEEGHEFLSPLPLDSFPPISSLVKMCAEDVQLELNRLIAQISDQKTIVLECLENDSDARELKHQMSLLQQLRSRYMQIESLYGGGLRQKWFGYEDEDDDSFMLDKNGGGGDATPGGESELEDSEALSSVTDHDEHIESIVERRVEKRLQEIFEQLRSGQASPFFLGSEPGLHRRSFRRSMPSDLNHHFGSGSEDDILSESPNQNNSTIPRSLSMSSTIWPVTSLQNGVIPGMLDISIINYFLRGAGTHEHYQYEVLICTPSEKWAVLRRYTRFFDLRTYMKKKYGNQVAKIPFPGKRIFRRKSESVARERKKLLEDFLRNLIQICCTFITCPLHNVELSNVRSALIAFSGFFEKGIFDSTKYGTS